MNVSLADPPSIAGSRLAQQINSDGYAVIENFVDPSDLRVAQQFVSDAIARNNGEYVGFSGTKDLGGTFLANLPQDPSFIELCRDIYESGVGKPAPDVNFYQILRCLSGSEAQDHSMMFHFDSYVLTALIPITVPAHGMPGRLVIHPNTRNIRKTYLGNLVDKAIVDNRIAQNWFKKSYQKGADNVLRLTLKPGNLYLFWGYRSLHTNEACDADAIRATALLHYADPHADSRLKQMLRRH